MQPPVARYIGVWLGIGFQADVEILGIGGRQSWKVSSQSGVNFRQAAAGVFEQIIYQGNFNPVGQR